jgi:hypothetical protein
MWQAEEYAAKQYKATGEPQAIFKDGNKGYAVLPKTYWQHLQTSQGLSLPALLVWEH